PPLSLNIPSSESRTPSQPVGVSTGGDCGDSEDGVCAPAAPPNASDATSAAAATGLLLIADTPLPVTCLEPPQREPNRPRGHLLRGDASTHRREIVLVDHWIVRCGSERTLHRIVDLVEGGKPGAIDARAVYGGRTRRVRREKRGRALIAPNPPPGG